MERYLRGKADRGPVRIGQCAGRCPVRPPVRLQDPRGRARCEAIKHEAVLVAVMLRRYADGAIIADLAPLADQ